MSLDLDPSVIWRDFTTDGVPASGRWEPRKVDIRQYESAVRQAVIALLADADPGLDLPNLLIRASDAGAGTPNAIQATTNLPVPAGDATALIALNIFEPNTGSPVTVSLNGGAALTIKTIAGNDVEAGGLVGNVLGVRIGSTFQLFSDQASAALLAAVEAAADRAEAAADALAGVEISTFATKAVAEAYAPAVAPTFLRTAFYDGDQVPGSGALYANNGTSSGDLVITLDDGVTAVGFDRRPDPVYRTPGFGVIGDVDDRTTWQAALDKLQNGDALHFPAGLTSNIQNAVGTGADLVAQRADAVANSGLRALTCDKDDITIVIDGKVNMLSALDDLFRFTGDRVKVIVNGELRGPGVYLDTNNNSDATVQWFPSLIRTDGLSANVKASRLVDAPTIGLFLRGTGSECDVGVYGGPTSKGSGTVMMGVYAATPQGGASRQKIKARVEAENGGAVYSGVFSVAADTEIEIRSKDLWEHGVYAYGANNIINNPQIDGCVVAAGLQSFGPGTQVIGGYVKNCPFGGYQSLNMTGMRLIGTEMYEGVGGYGFVGRSAVGVNPAGYIEDFLIDGLRAWITGTRQSPLNIALDQGFRGGRIVNYDLRGAAVSGLGSIFGNAGLFVGVTPTSNNAAEDLEIGHGTIRNSDEYAILLRRVQKFGISRPRIIDANGVTGNVAARIMSSADGCMDDANVVDTRGTKLTTQIVSATTADLNSGIRARRNQGYGLLASASPLVSLPDNMRGSGNSQDGWEPEGTFTFPSGASTKTVNSADHPAAAAIRVGARIRLEPDDENARRLQRVSGAYVSAVANGQFTVNIVDGNTAATAASFTFKIDQ